MAAGLTRALEVLQGQVQAQARAGEQAQERCKDDTRLHDVDHPTRTLVRQGPPQRNLCESIIILSGLLL